MPRRSLLLLLLLLLPTPARAVWAPEGVDLTRPRLLLRPGDVPALQAKLDATPTPAWLARVMDRIEATIAEAATTAPGDDSITAQRLRSRAARNLAFLYAVDRRRVAGVIAPFPSAAERQAVGDTARAYLLDLYERSRIAVPPPLGGWDRDISTSEELLSWAVTYDTLAGAGYDFGGHEAEIVERIANLASELYLNYTQPFTTTNFVLLHQNNHRSKSGASLVVAGIALAEYQPPPGSDPLGIRDPADWIEYGLDQADLVARVALSTNDGAYAEGPFYFRFASQNLIPFARAWDRLLGGRPYQSFGNDLPSLWSHPLYERMLRWMLDLTLPDGSLAPIDDGNPGRSHYFGAVPPGLADVAAYYWRWANAPSRFETEGNIDLSAETIALYDPSVVPAPPAGSPTAFYPEGGNAVFRSDWSQDAVVALVLSEYDTASLFTRDRQGRGMTPQGHEHPDAGAFLLHAFGERLALDPGYLSFGQRDRVALAEHHNLILVDGNGPYPPASATLLWSDPAARPTADGHARLSDTLDTEFLDAARVTTSYGSLLADPLGAPLVERRFLFPDHRYLAVADRVTSRDGAPHELTWLVHGHGGGTEPDGSPGGSYTDTPTGGRWQRGAARLDAALALSEATPVFETALAEHESVHSTSVAATHVVLRGRASGQSLAGLLLLYPSRSAAAPPVTSVLDTPGAASVLLHDDADDRRVLAWQRPTPAGALRIAAGDSGLADAEADGTLALFDARADGSLRLAYAEGATSLRYAGTTWLASRQAALLAVALAGDAAHFVVDDAAPEVTVPPLPFAPARADGACALTVHADGSATVRLGGERRFSLAAGPGNSRPAADPGARQLRLPLGFALRPDGRGSCDADGDALTPRWRLLSAPTQHDWRLADADTWTPTLRLDRPGAYRLELVVRDVHGADSLPRELAILAGPSCEDGVDDDLDGWIDGDDPTCASGAESVRVACGFGPELAAPLLLAWLARRARRRARG
jgi:hypothetical protein